MNTNITRIHEDDYMRYSIVKPSPDHNIEERYTRVIIDSRTRNKSLFPNPNDYEVQFDDDVYDVTKAQMIYMDMPFSSYLINSNFNTINIDLAGDDYTVTMPSGDYTLAEFNTDMQTALNTALGSNTVVLSYSSKTDKYTFTSASAFTFQFTGKTNSLALLLGFRDDADYTAPLVSSSYVLTAPFRRNFNFNNYIIMDIDQFDLLRSSDSELNKTFAVIPKNYATLGFSDPSLSYVKRFSTPIPRMNKLRIRLYDRFGKSYDFQNQDHRFELLITSFKQKAQYYGNSTFA